MAEIRGREHEARVAGKRLYEIPIVVAEIAIEIGGPIEGPAAAAEDVLECGEMHRLGIGQDAVEVEHDGSRHFASRSPA